MISLILFYIIKIIDNCPGVNYLTSQCSVAKMAGLRIDDEAKNLCNRHEICYTCVSRVATKIICMRHWIIIMKRKLLLCVRR